MMLDGDSFLSLDIQPMGVWVLRMGGDVVALSDYELKTSRIQFYRTNGCSNSTPDWLHLISCSWFWVKSFGQ